MDKMNEIGEEIYEYINKYINPNSDSIDITHHSQKVCKLVREATQGDDSLIR
jgi:septum formation topological specificity factor MinE